ncbi:MFS transporter [Spongiactinospora sp. TRM90649]|uniref:MFS transporter n=1 Tax=Spongiactinospora sp. TRM90649 TaxID=3031114 RepID=UPI0023FA2F82|nr:MFS transporter [Spongiactinospora sp. TRM90649]MDF5757814.1 MFS transporter [Spongiactinospora sp. TRM90649]
MTGGGWENARRAAGSASRRFARSAASAGRATVRAGRATMGGTRVAGKAAADGTLRVGRAARRLTHAQGAGRTGLGRLIELSALAAAGDALITVALAGTLFFGLPVDEARGQVALYLLITMAPFAVVAPLVGPALDRFRSGRRYVMAGTLIARGLLCWSMAAAVLSNDAVTLFPAALGVLVLSKAYNVSRAAIMPSVLPADIGLVTANARVALFTLVSAGVAIPVGAGLSAWLGGEWVLRGTLVLFAVVGVYALRLPRHVDAPDIEPDPDEEHLQERPARWRTLLNVGPAVAEAMRANAAIRFFSGFLLFFLLFVVQEDHLPGDYSKELIIAVLAGAAGAGGLAGAAVASWVRNRSPQVTVLITLALATAVGAGTAFLYNLWTAVAVALVAAFAQELGKLALDAIVQREIGEEVRSSTFGVVEALLQIAWVIGGLAGLIMSLYSRGPAALTVVAVAMGATLVWLVVGRRRRLRVTDARVESARARSSRSPAPAPASASAEAASGMTTTDIVPRPPADHGDKPGHTKPLTNPHG